MDFPTEIFGLAVCGLAASRLLSVYGKEGGIVRDGGSLPDGFPFFLNRKKRNAGQGRDADDSILSFIIRSRIVNTKK